MSGRIQLAAVGSCLTFLFPGMLLAQIVPVTLDQILTRALSESPLVKEVEVQIATRKGAGLSLKELENPTIDGEVRFPTSYREERGSDEIAVALSQPIRPSDFGSRGRVNSLIQQAADAEKKSSLLEFSQRLRLLYAKSWALERRSQQLKDTLRRSSSLEEGVKKASESGYLAEGERGLFKAEILRARYQLAAIASDASRAKAELSKAAGFNVEGALVAPPLSKIPPLSELITDDFEFPAQARAALAAKLADEQLKLAKLDAYPKFAPRIIYERTGDYTDYVGIGVSIDLPFFNRNKGEKIARAAEAAHARSVHSYFTGEGFKQEVIALRESIIAATSLLTGYEQEILPTLRKALAAEEKLLSSGQGSLFRVWQTTRELSAGESETVERTVKAFSDRAELSILIGKDL